jgi:hypothetical protein
MPLLHVGISNAEFYNAMRIAESKNMDLKDWAKSIIVSEIHKLSNSEKFTNTEGTPVVTQYERD